MYTIGWIKDNDIVAYKDKIAEIALKAAKEIELKKMLLHVEHLWPTF
jgi:hypothetical protein